MQVSSWTENVFVFVHSEMHWGQKTVWRIFKPTYNLHTSLFVWRWLKMNMHLHFYWCFQEGLNQNRDTTATGVLTSEDKNRTKTDHVNTKATSRLRHHLHESYKKKTSHSLWGRALRSSGEETKNATQTGEICICFLMNSWMLLTFWYLEK